MLSHLLNHIHFIYELYNTHIYSIVFTTKRKKKKTSLNLGYPMSHVASQKFKKKKKKTLLIAREL